MNNVIEVKEPFGDYKTLTGNISQKISDSEKTIGQINLKLADKDKWAGEANTQCSYGLRLIKQYTIAIKKLCEELDICLQHMDTNVSEFEGASKNVSKWNAW